MAQYLETECECDSAAASSDDSQANQVSDASHVAVASSPVSRSAAHWTAAIARATTTPPLSARTNPIVLDDSSGASSQEDELPPNPYLSQEVSPLPPRAPSPSHSTRADSPVSEAAEIPEGKSFRLNARSLLCTYANYTCKPTLEQFRESFLAHTYLREHPLRSYAISLEHHRSGVIHFHVFACFDGKLNTTNCRFLDLDCACGRTHHPNFRRIGSKQSLERAYCYVAKYGHVVSAGIDSALWPTYRNYRNSRADHDDWLADRKTYAPFNWPITWPDGTESGQPSRSSCLRSHVFVGPPGIGKSTWFMDTFASCSMWIAGTESKCRWDTYGGQEMLLFDDCSEWPTKAEIQSVLHVYSQPAPMPYTRHRPKQWKPKQVRWCVFLCNQLNELPYCDEEWFTLRFEVHYVTRENFAWE